MKTIAILPSGGEGKRLGSALPKQYIKVQGREIISYTIEVFQKSSLVDEIVIAAAPGFFGLIEKIKNEYGFTKITNICSSGKERQDSVYNALSSLDCNDDDLIAVHDAVRPLLPMPVLETAILSAKKSDNIVVAVKAKDTLIETSDLLNLSVDRFVERERIFNAQTPQIFPFKVLLSSMNKARNEGFTGTDESMIVKRAGFTVKIVEGASENFKITTESDLRLFDKLVSFYNNTD